ncbi:DUF892 family protein [Gluconobacter morbifer]|uniref:Uncharacterized protein n=1 Tax=Gluconobacter morbifer G707 TaxID=1088869 RepID=G6XK76_9PROT|nr:DUF892 family protein [Gluconobacter morbifer]EHH67672.1 hypothetical protein GMO_18920 [Gluconobacter morbifer G707]
MGGKAKSTERTALDVYVDCLRGHLAIETRAVENALSDLPACEQQARLSARLEQDLTMGRSHVNEITIILARHGHHPPVPHETVSSVLSTVSSFLHGGDDDDILQRTLKTVGYRAHQLASFETLIRLASRLGFAEDVKILTCLRDEEITSADWLGANLTSIIDDYIDAL